MVQQTKTNKPQVIKLNKVLEILGCSRTTFYEKYKNRLKSIKDPNHAKRQFYYLEEVYSIKKEIDEQTPYEVVE